MSKRNRKNRSRKNRVVRYAINPIKPIQPLGGGGNSKGGNSGKIKPTKPAVYDDKGNKYEWDDKYHDYVDSFTAPNGYPVVKFWQDYLAQKQREQEPVQSQNDLQGVYESPEDIESSNVSNIVDQARNGVYDDDDDLFDDNVYYDEDYNPFVPREEQAERYHPRSKGIDPYPESPDDDDYDPLATLDDVISQDSDDEPEPKKEAPSEDAARAINKEANAPEGKKSHKPFANRDDVVGWDEGQTADGRVYHVGFNERGKAVVWEDEDGNEIDNPNKEAKEESNKAAQGVGNDKPIESEKPQEKKEEKEKPKNGKRYDDWEVKGVDIPSERDIAVVTQVRRNLNIGWGDAFKKVADKLRKGENEKALRMLQKAGYKCLDLYRRAYMVHGDGDVLKYICGDNYQYESGERVRLALQDKLREIWESGAEKMNELGERLYALGGSEVCAKYGGKVCEGDNDEASKLFSSLGDDWRDFLGDEEEEEALEVPESDQRSEEAAKAVGDAVDDAPVETPKKEDNGKPVVDLAQPDEDDDFYGDFAPAWEESEEDDEDVFYEEEALALPKNTQDREEAARELHKDLAKPEAPKPGMVAGRPTDDQIVEGQYYSVNIGDLNLDPDRFQFKLDVDKKTGAGSSLKGGKFNPGLAGVITVWRDPENGKDYVVNGHHRFNLALENGYEGNLTVKYLDVGTADEAKSEGAIENIADSKGTSVDVADIMRSHPDKMTQNYLIERGVSPGVGIMREGAKLAALSEEVYKDVKLGQIDPSFAAVLGEYLPITAENPENEDKQNALYRKYIRPQLDKESTGDYKGKRLTKDDVKNYALAFLGVQGRDRGTQALFDLGLDYSAEFEARLELIRHVRNALRAQKAANSAVARKNAGDILMNGGVATSVDVDAAKRNKKTYSDTLTLFEETIPLQGELNDRFNQFVDKYVGSKNADDKQRIADGATEAVVDFFNGGPRGLIGGQAGSDLRGSETVENDGLVHSDAPGDDRQRDRLDASREGMADPRGGEDGKGGLFSGADSEGDGIEASTAESAPESERRQSSNRKRGNASDIGSLMSYDPASVPDSFFTPNYAAQTNNAGQSLTENPAPKQKEIDEGEEEALALPKNTQDREEASRELHEDLAQTGDDESAKEPVAAPTPNEPAQTDAAEGSEALDVPPSDQAPDEAVVDAVNREPVETPKEEDIDDSLYKIDEDLAKRAHEARFSHPYVAGNATREYEKDVKDAEKLYDELWDKSTYEYHDRLEDVFNDYKQSLAQWWNDYHGAVASGSAKSEIERLLASRPTFAQYKQDMFGSVPEEGRLESFGTSAEAAANLATYRQMLDEGKYYQVSEQLAENANRMNSFRDYAHGSANAEYRAEVDEMRKLAEQAKAQKDEETRNKIDGLCRAYEARLARWYDANNRNNASTPSIMIAGGDGMNRRRKEKQNQRRDNIMRDRYNEEKGFEAYYRNKIRGIANNSSVISSDDEDAIAKLEEKIKALQERSRLVKEARAYLQKHKTWDGYDGDLKDEIAKTPGRPDGNLYTFGSAYYNFGLDMESANREIRRLEARLGELKNRANTSYGGDVEFEGGRVHFNTANNRIQIIHDEKPGSETIDKLKRSGFIWSPRDKAWQRMLNGNGIYAAKQLGYLPKDYVAKNLADVPATDSSLAGSVTTQYPDLYRDGKRLVDEYKAIPYSGKDSGDKAKEILEFFKNASNDLDEDSFRRLAGVLGFPVKAKTKRGMMNNVSARLTNYALAKPIAPKTHATPLNEQQWDGRRPKSFSIHRLSTGSAIVNFGGDTASGGLAKTLLESRRFTGDTLFDKRANTLRVRIRIGGDKDMRGKAGATLLDLELELEDGKMHDYTEEFILDAPCTPENFEKVKQAGFLPANMEYQDFAQSDDEETLDVPPSDQPADEAVVDVLNRAPLDVPKEAPVIDDVHNEGATAAEPPTAEKEDKQANYSNRGEDGYYLINEKLAKFAHERRSTRDYHANEATNSYRQEVDRARRIAREKKGRVPQEYHEEIDALLDRFEKELAEWYDTESQIDAMTPSSLEGPGNNNKITARIMRKREKQGERRRSHREEYDNIQKILDKIGRVGTSISSDDQNAVAKLKAKLERLRQYREDMKEANAYRRKHGSWEGYQGALSLEVRNAIESSRPNFNPHFNRSLKDPHDGWFDLDNNRAEIRRTEGRIKSLEKTQNADFSSDVPFDGGKVRFDTANNRIQIMHDARPDADAIRELKSRGFRWSPSEKAWQRMLNDNGIYAAKQLGYLPTEWNPPLLPNAYGETEMSQDSPSEQFGATFESNAEALNVPPSAQTSEEAATGVGDAVDNSPLFDEGRELFKSFKADYSNEERFDAIIAFLKRASKKLKVQELKTFVKDCFGVDASNRRTKGSIQDAVATVLIELAMTKHKRDQILGYGGTANKDSLGDNDVAEPDAAPTTEDKDATTAAEKGMGIGEGAAETKSKTVEERGYSVNHDVVPADWYMEKKFGVYERWLKMRTDYMQKAIDYFNKHNTLEGCPLPQYNDAERNYVKENNIERLKSWADYTQKEYEFYKSAMASIRDSINSGKRSYDIPLNPHRIKSGFKGFIRFNQKENTIQLHISVPRRSLIDDESTRFLNNHGFEYSDKKKVWEAPYTRKSIEMLTDMYPRFLPREWERELLEEPELEKDAKAAEKEADIPSNKTKSDELTNKDAKAAQEVPQKVKAPRTRKPSPAMRPVDVNDLFKPGKTRAEVLVNGKWIREEDATVVNDKWVRKEDAPTNEAPHSNSSAEEPTQPGDAPKQSAASVKADDTVKGSARKPPKTAAKPKKIQTRDYFETAKKRKEALDGRYEYALSAEERQKLPQFKPGDVRLTWTLGGNVSTGGKSSIDFDGKTKRNARGFIIDRPHITMWCQDGISAESFANNFGGRVLRDSAVIPKVQMDFTPGTIAALKRHGYLPYDWNPPFIKKALKSIWKENPRNKGSEPPEKWYSGVYPKGGGITNINRGSFYVASLLGSDVCFDMFDGKIAIHFGSAFNPVAESEIASKLKQTGFTEVGSGLQSDYSPKSIDALRECGILPHDWDSSEAEKYYEAHEGSVKKIGRVSEHVPSHLAEYEETARKQVGGKVYSSRPSAQYSRASERAARLIHRDVAQRERLRSSL